MLTEVLVAPQTEPAALEVLAERKNLRVLSVAHDFAEPRVEYRPVTGRVLLQQADLVDSPGDDPDSWKLVGGQPPDSAALRDLAFAWRACRSVKSDAILMVRDGAAADAFFPFPDGLQILIDAGVGAVVQPGGSVRDDDVVAAVRMAGIIMYLIGTRRFWH